jgi:hypothetical protein
MPRIGTDWTPARPVAGSRGIVPPGTILRIELANERFVFARDSFGRVHLLNTCDCEVRQ